MVGGEFTGQETPDDNLHVNTAVTFVYIEIEIVPVCNLFPSGLLVSEVTFSNLGKVPSFFQHFVQSITEIFNYEFKFRRIESLLI